MRMARNCEKEPGEETDGSRSCVGHRDPPIDVVPTASLWVDTVRLSGEFREQFPI
jgi:hypothetical protein